MSPQSPSGSQRARGCMEMKIASSVNIELNDDREGLGRVFINTSILIRVQLF